MIFPEDFISRLEELGLIDQLGWIVARRGLVDLSRFKDRNGVAPRLAFNVSASSLVDLKFPDTMSSLITGHGVSPDNVNLEITESGLIKELARTLDVLARLRMKRVHLSIDDFGTGYSMMQQLRNIPATELKIDRSFVMKMVGSDRDRVMVQKTIEIGHELEMRVVAEGVETPEQLEILRLSGCDTAQGYLFSHPLPAEDSPELALSLSRSPDRAPRTLRNSPRRSPLIADVASIRQAHLPCIAYIVIDMAGNSWPLTMLALSFPSDLEALAAGSV